jgi:hypothetical protein
MPRLLQWSENAGFGATIKLDNGDVVYIAVARTTVSVRQWDLSGLITTVMSRFFGPKLYGESGARKYARTAEALSRIYPDQTPALPRFDNPRLAAFANAVWHCGSAAEVSAMLNDAAAKAAE